MCKCYLLVIVFIFLHTEMQTSGHIAV